MQTVNMQPSLESTESLIDQIRSGSTYLYAHVVKRFDKYLYKIGRSYGYDHQTTEDLMQEAFLKAYVHLPEFKNRSTFKTWLVQIMLRECYRRIRKAAYKYEVYPENKPHECQIPVFESKPKNVDEVVENFELKQNLEKAITCIPEKYRSVFVLRELNDLSVHETAICLGISEVNVKVRLNRAKIMLRQVLSKTYNSQEIFSFNLVYCEAFIKKVMKAIENAANPETLN